MPGRALLIVTALISGARSSVLCTTVQTHGRRALLEVIGSRGAVRLVDEDELAFGTHESAMHAVDVKLPTVAAVRACNDSAFARCEPLFLKAVIAAVAAHETSLPGAATFDDGTATGQGLAAARVRSDCGRHGRRSREH